MFRIQYDTSVSLKKDREKIIKNFRNFEKIRKSIEKLSIMFPNISNIKKDYSQKLQINLDLEFEIIE